MTRLTQRWLDLVRHSTIPHDLIRATIDIQLQEVRVAAENLAFIAANSRLDPAQMRTLGLQADHLHVLARQIQDGNVSPGGDAQNTEL